MRLLFLSSFKSLNRDVNQGSDMLVKYSPGFCCPKYDEDVSGEVSMILFSSVFVLHKYVMLR